MKLRMPNSWGKYTASSDKFNRSDFIDAAHFGQDEDFCGGCDETIRDEPVVVALGPVMHHPVCLPARACILGVVYYPPDPFEDFWDPMDKGINQLAVLLIEEWALPSLREHGDPSGLGRYPAAVLNREWDRLWRIFRSFAVEIVRRRLNGDSARAESLLTSGWESRWQPFRQVSATVIQQGEGAGEAARERGRRE